MKLKSTQILIPSSSSSFSLSSSLLLCGFWSSGEQQVVVKMAGGEQFPMGMRVLAVDDDPTCLALLHTLLTRCHYQVKTTNKATEALKMLRENKFDLVISDVHMPDMDGFKLLELVGLEMDLPVIMLSANGDPKLVMKGIDHGACDYLLKPIRIEELKNIWQHVIRKKKHDPNQERRRHADLNEHVCRKRKDQDEEDENGENEDDDPSAQKKPRVVWSVDLHRKFVLAVNQLGLDNAVPKKILDLMNEEKLSRENVASHLQKYRLYLKRIRNAANQHANMAAAMSNTDPEYTRVGFMNGIHNLTGSSQFPSSMYSTFPSNGRFSTFHSGIVHMGHLQNSGTSAGDQAEFQTGMFPGMPIELDRGLPNAIDDMAIFSICSGIPDQGICRSDMANAAHSPRARSNSFPSGESFQRHPNPRDTVSTMSLPFGTNSTGAFSTSTQMQYRRAYLHGQASPDVSARRSISNASTQGFDFYEQDSGYRPEYVGSSMSSMPPLSQSLGTQFNFTTHSELEKLGVETSMQLHDGFVSNNLDPWKI